MKNKWHLFQIQNNVGRILNYTLYRRKLVLYALDLYSSYRCSLDR